MTLLSIDNLAIGFVRHQVATPVVHGVSLQIAAGECVGVVGESGSGKTQVFMAAMRLLADNAEARGSVRFADEELLTAPLGRLNRLRGAELAMIFQDPMTSLTPHLPIGTQLAEVLVQHVDASWSEARGRALQMLERLRVPEPALRLRQYPHELSGGLRQRVMIALSLLCGPKLVIADEPTTALDVTVQAQIIGLLRSVRAEIGMALVLISHDFGVVAGLADRILVMYAGRIIESAAASLLFARPQHPYTAQLLRCMPSLSGPPWPRLPTLAGQPPRAGELAPGCAFAPRCARAAERCRSERPLLGGVIPGVACHFPLSP